MIIHSNLDLLFFPILITLFNGNWILYYSRLHFLWETSYVLLSQLLIAERNPLVTSIEAKDYTVFNKYFCSLSLSRHRRLKRTDLETIHQTIKVSVFPGAALLMLFVLRNVVSAGMFLAK